MLISINDCCNSAFLQYSCLKEVALLHGLPLAAFTPDVQTYLAVIVTWLRCWSVADANTQRHHITFFVSNATVRPSCISGPMAVIVKSFPDNVSMMSLMCARLTHLDHCLMGSSKTIWGTFRKGVRPPLFCCGDYFSPRATSLIHYKTVPCRPRSEQKFDCRRKTYKSTSRRQDNNKLKWSLFDKGLDNL
jgi:hypothetical protein